MTNSDRTHSARARKARTNKARAVAVVALAAGGLVFSAGTAFAATAEGGGDSPPWNNNDLTPAGVPVTGTVHAVVAGAQSMVPGQQAGGGSGAGGY